MTLPLTPKEANRLRRAMIENDIYKMPPLFVDCGHSHKFADCTTATVCPGTDNLWGCKNKKKEEIPMSSYSTSAATVVTASDIEKNQRRTLSSALYDAFRDKVQAAKEQFGLKPDEMPRTLQGVVDAIQAGKFTLDPKLGDYYATDLYAINWRDPSKTVDEAGYKAARAELDKAYKALELRIAILPLADALTTVENYRDGK